MATIDEIKQQAEAVKNATQVGENTAGRVGGALAGLADIAKQQDTELGKKADKETVNSALGKKADKTYMDTELGKKIDKASIAQTSGESEELVMSQKAVSTKLKEVLEIGADGGNMILDWNTDVATTRKQVLQKYRKQLLQISYKNANEDIVNEQYVGTLFTDTEWVKDSNWQRFDFTTSYITEGNKTQYQINNEVRNRIYKDIIYTIQPAGLYPHNTVLATNETLQVGTIIHYHFTCQINHVGGIRVFDTNNSEITYIGKVTSNVGITEYEGTYIIPNNFGSLKVISNGNGIKIIDLYYTEPNENYIVKSDKTLTIDDGLADAKVVGDKFNSLENYDTSIRKNRTEGSYFEGNKGASTGYISVKNAIFDSYNQFIKLETYVVNSGTIKAKIIDYDTLEMIEEITVEAASSGKLTINSSDFAFDFDAPVNRVCIFLGTTERIIPFRNDINGNLVYFKNDTIEDISNSYAISILFYVNSTYPLFNEIENLKNKINQVDKQVVIKDLQKFINGNRNALIPAGTYYIDTPLTIPNGTKISGVRGSTIIKLRNASSCISITNCQDIQITDITFEGTGAIAPSPIELNDIKNRTNDGTKVGIYMTGSIKSVFISNCRFKNFDLAGIHTYKTSGGLTEAFKITDCVFEHNWYGYLSDVRSEYNTCIGCSMNSNQIGCFIAGGNNYLACNHFDKNSVGCVISGTAGDNDSHGSITGSSFNHNSVFGIAIIDIRNGFSFNGCHVFDGVIKMYNSKGFTFVGGIIAGKLDNESPNTHSINMIHSNIFFKDYSGGTITDLTSLDLKNNRFIDGSDSSSINN